MAIEAIAAINDPAFKTGIGKNNKPWTMMQVTTDKNNVTTVFAPAAIGDKLELTWNDQYGNFSAKKVSTQEVAQLEGLRKIYELQLAIFKAITGEDYGKQVRTVPDAPAQPIAAPPQPVAPTMPVDQVHEPTPEEMSGQINLSDIPF